MFSMLGALLMASLAACKAFTGNAPIIGIYSMSSIIRGDYIAASYVKWIESAGGRVVPLPFHITRDDAIGNLTQINGLLFPGGGNSLPDNARFVFDYAMSLNKQGDYFPIWGTCNGFEWIMQCSGGELDKNFDSENLALPLVFRTNEHTPPRLFANAPKGLMEIYQKQSVTMNNHHQGIEVKNFESNHNLTTFFKILSTNQDRKGREFVSTVEAYKYPVFASQWHPEKNAFEWNKDLDGVPTEVIPHSSDAVSAGLFPATFFVNEARKNKHQFSSAAAEAASLIWNYPVTNTQDTHSFTQVYAHIFTPRS